MRTLAVVCLALAGTFFTLATIPARAQGPNWIVDAAKATDSLPPVWASIGADEPNYATTPDGLHVLDAFARLGIPVYVRLHNLLTTGDGRPALKWGSTNAYTADAAGNPVYDWTILDSIFDALVSRGLRPLAEIGFMPEALSTHPEPYRHHWAPGKDYSDIFTGWAYPPNDYDKWSALVEAWVRHCVIRYSAAKVRTWYWEVWNEPNIGYWKGTPAAYDSLYDYTAAAVRRACPGARVGGPASTGPGWDKAADYLRAFLEHCHSGHNAATGGTGAPLDFISFHAKGSPRLTAGHVVMHMAPELRDVETGFQIVARSPYSKLPVIISEFDPEGCAACGVSTNPENAYRNGTMYSSYTAEAFARLYDLVDKYHVNLAYATTWAFTFANQPWFAGFRELATHGIDKPVLDVFRMLSMMRGRRIPVDGPVLATPGQALIWNYQPDESRQDTLRGTLVFRGIPGAAILHVYRIDETSNNAYTAWQKMGSPQNPTPEQTTELRKAGDLTALYAFPVSPGRQVEVPVALPARAVWFVELENSPAN